MSLEDQLRAAIRCLVPGAEAASMRFRALAGGTGARTFLVSSAEHTSVVRLPQHGFREGLLHPSAERAFMQRAAEAGLAPAVRASDAATGLLITQYMAGARPWTQIDARAPHNIARIASLLRSLHALPAELPPFPPQRFARQYLAAAPPATSLEQEWARELREAAQDFEARWPPSVPCHNDLTPSNILDDGALRLVDFEFAAASAPVLDLAGLAAMSHFDESQRRLLIDAYYAGARAGCTEAELDAAVRLVRLLAYFWARACSGLATQPEAYHRLGEQFAAVLNEN